MNSINISYELEKTRAEMIALINENIDRLIENLDDGCGVNAIPKHEWPIPLSTNPAIFIGQKPLAVLIGDERISVKSWTGVFTAILKHCDSNAVYHEKLMDLRGKIAGKSRVFLAESAADMSKPVKIAEKLYAEGHFGSAGMMHVLCKRILAPVGFDCSNVYIILKS